MSNQSSVTVISGSAALGIAMLRDDAGTQQGIFVADFINGSPHLIFDVFLNAADPEPVEAEIEEIPFRRRIGFELVESLPFGALAIVGSTGWEKWCSGKNTSCDISGIASKSRETCFWNDELISFCDGRLGSPRRQLVPPRWWLTGLIGIAEQMDLCIVNRRALSARGCIREAEGGTCFFPDQDQWKY